MSSPGSADSPVRVLIVAPAPLDDPRSGGIANFIRGFIRHMPADFEIELVGAAVGDEQPGTRWHEIEIAGRRVRFMPVARLRGARRAGRIPAKARIVAGLLSHRRALPTRGRVVQLHAPGMDLGLLGRRGPTVRVVHNAPEDLAGKTGESLWGRFAWLLRPLERWTFGRSETFFVSRATRDVYAARMPQAAARMHHLPLAIDRSMFFAAPEEERAGLRDRLAKTHDLPLEAHWLLFAGRLDQQKDPLLAVRAFAALASTGSEPPAHLVVVGDGRQREAAEQLAAELDVAPRVHFVGALARPALAEVMRAADAFLLTSEFEAGPFVVLEALASGLPVATTNVGEVPHMVRHAETGWISDEHTPEALAEAARWALSRQRALIAPQAVASTAAHDIGAILEPFYEAHRRLARSD